MGLDGVDIITETLGPNQWNRKSCMKGISADYTMGSFALRICQLLDGLLLLI